MSFITDTIKDITGAGAMEDATDIQRQQFDYYKGLNEADRADLLKMYGDAEKEGFFDWQKRLGMYDAAVAPDNERDLANVGGALRRAGARPGDTNGDAAVAMVLNAQKKQRGEQAMKFFDQGFRDRFMFRKAISGDTQGLGFQAGRDLSGNLMQQGQAQQQQFRSFLTTAMMAGGGAGKPSVNPNLNPGNIDLGPDPNTMSPNGGNTYALGASRVKVGEDLMDEVYRPQPFLDRATRWAA